MTERDGPQNINVNDREWNFYFAHKYLAQQLHETEREELEMRLRAVDDKIALTKASTGIDAQIDMDTIKALGRSIQAKKNQVDHMQDTIEEQAGDTKWFVTENLDVLTAQAKAAAEHDGVEIT